MIPMGYMLKGIAGLPEWLNAPQVEWIYSVSGCTSPEFPDYIPHWKHNGWWMFDEPGTMRNLAKENGVDLNVYATTLYYEVFENEYDAFEKSWLPIAPEPGFPTAVVVPTRRALLGFDVVSFAIHTSPECSPLSCNHLAETTPTNRNCLFDDFETARNFVESDALNGCEDGPYRIIAVYETG